MNARLTALNCAAALAMALALAWLGPTLLDRAHIDVQHTAATAWAIEQARIEQRREAAGRAVCGPQALASWSADGHLLCTNGAGRSSLHEAQAQATIHAGAQAWTGAKP